MMSSVGVIGELNPLRAAKRRESFLRNLVSLGRDGRCGSPLGHLFEACLLASIAIPYRVGGSRFKENVLSEILRCRSGSEFRNKLPDKKSFHLSEKKYTHDAFLVWETQARCFPEHHLGTRTLPSP